MIAVRSRKPHDFSHASDSYSTCRGEFFASVIVNQHIASSSEKVRRPEGKLDKLLPENLSITPAQIACQTHMTLTQEGCL
jgi:hypothetical protein